MLAALRRAPAAASGAAALRRCGGRLATAAAHPAATTAPATPGPHAALSPHNAVVAATTTAARSQAPLLYWKLAKGKLTVWVAISAMPGYLLAVPAAIEPLTLSALACGTFLTSASAQTMNQMYEVRRDSLMKRTRMRPLPSGQLSQSEAACFATASGAVGLGVLTAGASPTAAVIAATTMVTYVAAYTPLKVLTPYNTHIGAISGALPTLLGFSAALGGDFLCSPWGGHALWLFAMQVLWQMPHFYALAWIHRADYLRGGYTMFPLTDATGCATAAMSKPYLAALCAMPWGLSACGLASWMLPVGAALPSLFWWRSLCAFERKPNAGTCRRFFLGSLSYLISMLALFTAFARVEQPQPRPALQAGAEASDGDEEKEAAVVVGPAWRASLHSVCYEACPHEKVRYWFFGVGKGGCPISRQFF